MTVEVVKMPKSANPSKTRKSPETGARKGAAHAARAEPGKAAAEVRVSVLAFEGCMASSVLAPLELFDVANALSEMISPETRAPRFAGSIVSADGAGLTTRRGVHFDAGPAQVAGTDALIVPGIWHATARDLAGTVKGLAAESAVLRAHHEAGVMVGAICSGTALLAETGLLDGREATTSWWLGEMFRRRYPAVRLSLDKMLTFDGKLWCAGAATAHLNMCLKLIEHFAGAEIASLVSRWMLIDPNRDSQAPYAMIDLFSTASDPVVAKAQAWIKGHLTQAIELAQVAEVAAVSTRTLIRRFHEATGQTPLSYIQKLRVERAKGLLSTTALAVERIMDKSGYSDMSGFRKLFRDHTGLTPHEYRERFRVRGLPRDRAAKAVH
jgi:transcriptional regulator GlxA family with amidase domain